MGALSGVYCTVRKTQKRLTMKRFIGTKVINAKPMNRLEYNQFRGWTLPDDENGEDEGFLVEYVDGGQANTTEYSGYVSWSPKDVFERAYKASGNLAFGDAIEYMKQSHKVARSGWNGKGMWVSLFSSLNIGIDNDDYGIDFNFDDDQLGEKQFSHWKHHEGDESYTIKDCVCMFTASGEIQLGWLASQADMLAEDWVIIE